jgi:hypothetical protein
MLCKSATAAAVSGSALCVLAVPSNVAYWGQSGKHMLDLRFTAFDPERTSTRLHFRSGPRMK